MGLGDTLRAWIDPPGARRSTAATADEQRQEGSLAEPVEPVVRSWLERELPRLRAEGLLSQAQAERITRRYAVAIPATSGAVEPAATAPAARAPGDAPAGEAQSATATRRAGPSLAPFLSEHGVSLVLYLGAFLVAAAVIIYLAYNWGRVGGATKLAALIGLTAAFLAAAAICLPRPSVRPAGRTFLALGSILVPANFAAAYAFIFADGPFPQAAFWLLGAVASGALFAALSLRLESRAYGLLATLALPVAAAALVSLIGLSRAWWGPAVEIALALVLLASDYRPQLVLTRAARLIAGAGLPLGAVLSLEALLATGLDRWAAPAGLLVMALASGREAIRRGELWMVGPLAACLLVPLSVLAAADAEDVRAYAASLAASSWLYVLVARRLDERPARVWDLAGGLVAWLPPFLVWDQSPLAAGLFGATTALFVALSRARRSPVLVYPAWLAADLAVVKTIAIFGAPDSPLWQLGVTLWPLALVWWGAAAVTPWRWSHPFWAAALLTGVVAAALTRDQRDITALMAASFALASAMAAWRIAEPIGLVVSGLWLMLAAYQAAAGAGLDEPARLVAIGFTAWAFAPLFRLYGAAPTPAPATALDQGAFGRATRVILETFWSWAATSQRAAIGIAALAAAGVLVAAEEADALFAASAVAWANLALVLGSVAFVNRSAVVALGAALTLLPAMLAGIARAHPGDAQAYALPGGLYLLAIAHVARSRQPPGRGRAIASLATLGVAALLAPGVVQSLDADGVGHALWTAVEGLAVACWGIATRWRPLAAGGVAAVVAIALRQLFDVVHALPSWILLGGTGLALLAAAVVLLLLRDRLLAAGRAVSDRWSSWD